MHLPTTWLLCCLLCLTDRSTAQGQRPAAAGDAVQQALAAARARPAPPALAPLPVLALYALEQLRVGDRRAAHWALAAAREHLAVAAEADLPWLPLAHLWFARATGGWPTPELLARLRPAMERLRDAEVQPTFAAEALRIHGVFAFGALCDGPPDRQTAGEAGAAWTAAAGAQQCELERRAWQPGRGHFRPQLTAGDIALPATPDASLLLPPAVGMLVATGDRMHRHLTALLAADELPPGSLPEPFAAAPLLLAAATEMAAEDETKARYCAAVGAAARRGDALALDALLFAITGVRVATGAGLDETWLRWRPWLPPDTTRLQLAVLAGGGRFELALWRDADVRCRIDCVEAFGGGSITLVVDDGARQTMQPLRPGEAFAAAMAPRQRPPSR